MVSVWKIQRTTEQSDQPPLSPAQKIIPAVVQNATQPSARRCMALPVQVLFARGQYVRSWALRRKLFAEAGDLFYEDCDLLISGLLCFGAAGRLRPLG